MNPEGHPREFVTMPGFTGQPCAPTVVQYTTVNNMPTELPQDHIVWSLGSFVYFNPFCLGLAALIFSIKARDRKLAGDLVGARSYGATARWINIVSTVLISIIILIIIIVISK
ncbi:hypothetical protein PAMA_019699 [Pampus argenteus]